MKKTTPLFLILLCVAACVFAQPTISSVSPLVGYPASSVTIIGTNFNTTPANNIVYFGATQATVTTASASSLTVTVPTGATYMPVSVNNTASALTGYSQYPFLPTYDNSAYIPGTVNMNDKVDFTTGTSARSVAIGDLDGDGKADLAVVNAGSNTVSVFRNTSSSGAMTSGSFAARVDFTTGTQPWGVAIGDLDGDGKADLAVANANSNTVSVFRNTSSSGAITSGSFAARVDFTTGTNPTSVSIGDLDGDGKADLAVANRSSATVSVFRNTSSSGAITSGSFATRVDFTTGTNPLSVAIGDLDGDGKADLAVPNSLSATVSVFHNTSSSGDITSGSFAAKVDFAAGSNPYSVAIGDLDGDGKADLAVVNQGNTRVSVYRNTSSSGSISSSSFAAQVTFATGTQPRIIAIGDIDGDGKPDMVVTNFNSNTVSVFRNTSSSGSISSGSFAAQVTFAAGTQPFGVAIGDIDGDGKPDLAVANGGSTTVSVIRNSPLLPITGTTSVCAGGTTTLTNSTSGGTWSSSAAGIASVGSSTGLVTGVTAGTAMISYTVAGGSATVIVTVNASPAGVSMTASPNNTFTGVPVTFASTGGAPSCGGNALSFTGMSASSATASGVITTATDNITIEAWVRNTGSTAAYQFIFMNGNSGANGYGLIIPPGGGNLIILIAGINFLNSSVSLTAGVWQHVAIVRNAGTWSLYVDGTQYSVTSSGTGPITPGGTFVVGHGLNPNESFNGRIDEVKFWNVARTTPQIQASMLSCVTAPQANLIGYWKFNEGTGSTTADASGNGNSLTLASTSWVSEPSNTNTYTWAFGDATTATGTPVSHTYSTGATYTPTLTVSNSGCGTSVTTTVTVNATLGSISGSSNFCTGGAPETLSNATAGGTWSSSAPGIASIGSSSGILTAVAPGIAVITYQIGTATATHSVTVNSAPSAITGVLAVCAGSTSILSSATTSGTWSSDNASVATVGSGTGVVSGVAPGTATITYSNGGICIRTAVVSVNAALGANSGNTVVCAGQAFTLSNATGGGTWSSRNVAIATVHASTGLVTGVGAGITNITYTLSGGCYSITEVTVNVAMAAITGSGTVCAGSTAPLSHTEGGGVWSSSNTSRVTIDAGSGVMTGVTGGSATISYMLSAGCVTTRVVTVNVLPNTIGSGSSSVCMGGGTSYTCTPSGGTWSSTATGVATIGSTGVITSVSEGTSVISYTLATGCASMRTVTVLASPSAITGSASVCIGVTTTLSSSPAGGVWTSSAPSKATVVAGTGVLTGVSAGTSTISYTLSNGCRRTIAATVVTLPAPITGVLTLCSSCTTNLSSTTTSGAWTSSNTGVATVNAATGVVSGVGIGTSAISYTAASGCARTATVTVSAPPPAISGFLEVCVGQTNASLTHSLTGGTWSSSNMTVANVHAASGMLTGYGAGTATITYTTSPGIYTTVAVTVNAAVASISGTGSICPGATRALANATSGGVWSSTNPSIATIDAGTGVVTAVAAGTTTISYFISVGCYKTITQTVNSTPNVTGASNVVNGSSTTFGGSPAGGAWSSANPAIASVSSAGVVTGNSVAATTITYTLSSTGCLGTRGINVLAARPGSPLGGEVAQANALKVYPNPTSGILTIDAPVAGTFTVYTIDGKEVTQYEVTASANMVSLPSNLATGIYMCRFMGKDGTSAIVRLVYER